MDERCPSPWGAAHESACVGEHDRVVVDVDDPGLRRDLAGHLVHAAHRRDPRAHVEELAHPGIQAVPHRAAQETTVGVGDQGAAGHHRLDLLHHLPVDREVVRPAERVVVHAGRVRPGEIDAFGCPRWPFHRHIMSERCRPVTARDTCRRESHRRTCVAKVARCVGYSPSSYCPPAWS